MKHLLKLLDLTGEEITELLDLAAKIKADEKKGVRVPYLQGKTLGMIFAKSSTRTRVSFEVGMYQLGGYPLYLNSADTQLGRGEPVRDTARVLSRYLDGIIIRTFEQKEVEELAKWGSIPVVNALTDFAHPMQVLADLLTIREHKGNLKGLKLAFVGDGNNMANSLIVGCLKVGMKIAVACPKDYRPAEEVLKFAEGNPDFGIYEKPEDAMRGADVVYTDVWTSMGQEEEREKRAAAFDGYQICAENMALTNDGCTVLHCLPAHRGEEITEEVLEAHAGEIFDEAENRLHAQKAVLVKLMTN